MSLTSTLHSRYSTKKFDPDFKLTPEQESELLELLRMSPSSTNLQPWHFVIANTETGKARLAKGAEGFFHFNAPKIKDASFVVLFCARTDADLDYMRLLSEKEDRDGRYPSPEVKEQVFGVRNLFSDIHRYDLKDHPHWMEKQVYLNIGQFLLGAALMGLDALPMEGIDVKALDEEFDLRSKGYTSLVMVSVGRHAEGDFNIPSKRPKSRLPESYIFTQLD